MKRVSHNQIGICEGSQIMFSDFKDDGPMWRGDGPREKRIAVKFDEPYLDAPVVQVAMTMWDADHRSNQRMDLAAENVTATGFDLVFQTWGDSQVARVRAGWTAIGAVEFQEDWDLY